MISSAREWQSLLAARRDLKDSDDSNIVASGRAWLDDDSEMPAALPATTLPPAQPVYVLRGHGAAIHTLLFFRSNTRLLTGDAEGWIVIWSVAIRRPTAVWRAHEASILGAQIWGNDKLITHGRDSKIKVWAFSEEDEQSMSTILPIEDSISHRKRPWLLHSLTIPTLNFCSFACLPIPSAIMAQTDQQDDEEKLTTSITTSPPASSLLIAVSGQNDSTIDLYQLPSEKKVGMIPAPEVVNGKSGMVMALRMFHSSTQDLHVIAGYESGRTYVYKQAKQQWDPIYTACPHTQPILALDISPGRDFFCTSSADAIIARHKLDADVDVENIPKVVQTRHAGQQGLRLRSDGRIFATAGWDGRVRVYSAKSMKELAVLKWHKDGCYAVAFATIDGGGAQDMSDSTSSVSDSVVVTTISNAIQQTVGQARDTKARTTHWLAAGAKDGKVSLWDIY